MHLCTCGKKSYYKVKIVNTHKQLQEFLKKKIETEIKTKKESV